MLTHERQSVHVYAVPSHGEDTHTKASAVEHSLDSLHIWYWSNLGFLYIEKTLPLLSFCEPQIEFVTYMWVHKLVKEVLV